MIKEFSGLGPLQGLAPCPSHVSFLSIPWHSRMRGFAPNEGMLGPSYRTDAQALTLPGASSPFLQISGCVNFSLKNVYARASRPRQGSGLGSGQWTSSLYLFISGWWKSSILLENTLEVCPWKRNEKACSLRTGSGLWISKESHLPCFSLKIGWKPIFCVWIRCNLGTAVWQRSPLWLIIVTEAHFLTSEDTASLEFLNLTEFCCLHIRNPICWGQQKLCKWACGNQHLAPLRNFRPHHILKFDSNTGCTTLL